MTIFLWIFGIWVVLCILERVFLISYRFPKK